jgi:hypothetical protein
LLGKNSQMGHINPDIALFWPNLTKLYFSLASGFAIEPCFHLFSNIVHFDIFICDKVFNVLAHISI